MEWLQHWTLIHDVSACILYILAKMSWLFFVQWINERKESHVKKLSYVYTPSSVVYTVTFYSYLQFVINFHWFLILNFCFWQIDAMPDIVCRFLEYSKCRSMLWQCLLHSESGSACIMCIICLNLIHQYTSCFSVTTALSYDMMKNDIKHRCSIVFKFILILVIIIALWNRWIFVWHNGSSVLTIDRYNIIYI